MWIWEHHHWPVFRYDAAALAMPLAQAASRIGYLHGRIASLHGKDHDQAAMSALTADILESSAIEGEQLDLETVRSSLARRLGLDIGGTAKVDRHVDGVVEMTLDATRNATAPLTAKRLQGWQAALFPTGFSGLSKIRVAKWRNDAQGPMQVISGPIGRQRVHYQAPPASDLPKAMTRFLAWCESETLEPLLLKAALAHLWFVTLHPFDDGNGRIARAIGDLMLSRHDALPFRYYSLSAQILAEKKEYYAMLERTQRDGLDVTPWLAWFLQCLARAAQRSEQTLDRVIAKSLFWQRIAHAPLNARQTKALNKVLDEFEKPLTNRKWAALTCVSSDTALRDLRALVELGVVEPAQRGGRSAGYWLVGVPRRES
ncbi:MAG: Fic family protein [Pseudomarimonas sp.]